VLWEKEMVRLTAGKRWAFDTSLPHTTGANLSVLSRDGRGANRLPAPQIVDLHQPPLRGLRRCGSGKGWAPRRRKAPLATPPPCLHLCVRRSRCDSHVRLRWCARQRCESMRLSLEKCSVDKDIQAFIQDEHIGSVHPGKLRPRRWSALPPLHLAPSPCCFRLVRLLPLSLDSVPELLWFPRSQQPPPQLRSLAPLPTLAPAHANARPVARYDAQRRPPLRVWLWPSISTNGKGGWSSA
jgi:hypothetical protein